MGFGYKNYGVCLGQCHNTLLCKADTSQSLLFVFSIVLCIFDGQLSSALSAIVQFCHLTWTVCNYSLE